MFLCISTPNLDYEYLFSLYFVIKKIGKNVVCMMPGAWCLLNTSPRGDMLLVDRNNH